MSCVYQLRRTDRPRGLAARVAGESRDGELSRPAWVGVAGSDGWARTVLARHSGADSGSALSPLRLTCRCPIADTPMLISKAPRAPSKVLVHRPTCCRAQ